MLHAEFPGARVHQIDALQAVVKQAEVYNPQGKVEQLFASDMHTIDSCSKDLIVAMSVFDQNTDAVLSDISREIHRVLVPGGMVIYIHNEELNLPATAASHYDANQHLLLPNDRWRPNNGREYCSVKGEVLNYYRNRMQSEAEELLPYLRAIYPQIYKPDEWQSKAGRVDVPFLRKSNFSQFMRTATAVGKLRHAGMDVVEHQTSELLSQKIENELFSSELGWQVLESGTFELRSVSEWSDWFKQCPEESCFVRGIGRLGYATQRQPRTGFRQLQGAHEFCDWEKGERSFIAIQYGLAAMKPKDKQAVA